jgi:hypothetical protein
LRWWCIPRMVGADTLTCNISLNRRMRDETAGK